MDKKEEILKERLKAFGSVGVAFSGGVDSTFLLKTAHDLLGEKAIALTVRSRSFPKRELEESMAFCEKEGIKQIIIDFDELGVAGFSENPPDRCYLCKTELFKKMREAAAKLGVENIAEGSNTDDTGDHRPGMRAVAEQNIKSPLRDAGLSKNEIRELSKKIGLPTWNKPSFACLASRFPYGETITAEKLSTVEKAEEFLHGFGFKQVRVRMHGKTARIETEKNEFTKMIGLSDEISGYFKTLGFTYVSLDLTGYRTGSMNEVL